MTDLSTQRKPQVNEAWEAIRELTRCIDEEVRSERQRLANRNLLICVRDGVVVSAKRLHRFCMGAHNR